MEIKKYLMIALIVLVVMYVVYHVATLKDAIVA